jgi:hypothetical protein
MSLSAGDTIGPYAIVDAIGAGGMGEVYRAHDTKLGREVALKVVPEAFATDAERMGRLRREAKVLAMPLLDDSSPSAAKVGRAVVDAWPRLDGRVTFVSGAITDATIDATDVVVSSHACGTGTPDHIKVAARLVWRLPGVPGFPPLRSSHQALGCAPGRSRVFACRTSHRVSGSGAPSLASRHGAVRSSGLGRLATLDEPKRRIELAALDREIGPAHRAVTPQQR